MLNQKIAIFIKRCYLLLKIMCLQRVLCKNDSSVFNKIVARSDVVLITEKIINIPVIHYSEEFSDI